MYYTVSVVNNRAIAMLLQQCLTLWDPMDHSQPGSCVHGILQARILEWVAMPSSRGSSQPKGWSHISQFPALAGGFFTTSTIQEVHIIMEYYSIIYYSNIYVMEYYSAIKMNEIMSSAETWIDLEGIILSETSQRKTNAV